MAPVSERKGQFKDAANAVAEREEPEGTTGANESGVEPGGVHWGKGHVDVNGEGHRDKLCDGRSWRVGEIEGFGVAMLTTQNTTNQ